MKKVLSLACSLLLVLALLAGCGSDGTSSTASSTASSGSDGKLVTLKIGASPTPHVDILKQVVEPLKEEGIDLQIVEFSDYVTPNTALEDGDLDANYFQHEPYLEQFNQENGTHLVSVAKIHYEPLGIYPGKTATLDALPDGAVIAVPNDVTNEARALLLLQANGILTLKDGAGLNATKLDIASNPKNVKIMEVEAAQIAGSLPDVDLGVINANYALEAGLNPSDNAIAAEAADSDAAQTYANIIAVKEGNEQNPAILKLVAALQSDAVRDYINNTYNGAVVPVF